MLFLFWLLLCLFVCFPVLKIEVRKIADLWEIINQTCLGKGNLQQIFKLSRRFYLFLEKIFLLFYILVYITEGNPLLELLYNNSKIEDR